MYRSLVKDTKLVIFVIFLTFVFAGNGQAAQLSKNEYVRLWTNACIAVGKSQSTILTSHEWSRLLAARTMMEAVGVPEQMRRDGCRCMANYIASRKKNLSSSTPNSLFEKAVNACPR